MQTMHATPTLDDALAVRRADRSAAIVERFRVAQYPTPLLDALSRYLAGHGDLGALCQQWQQASALRQIQISIDETSFVGLVGLDGTQLDDLDRCLLDLCITRRPHDTWLLFCFIWAIAGQGPVAATYEYVIAQHIDANEVLESLLYARLPLLSRNGTPSALGAQILSLLPAQFETIRRIAETRDWRLSVEFVQLLMAARPPMTQLACTLIEPQPWFRYPSYAAPVLEADPSAFTHMQPRLHSAAAQGSAEALALLLRQVWDGRERFGITQLGHSAASMRATAAAWLMAQGETIIDDAATCWGSLPAKARLNLIAVLRELGNDRARGLLRSWLVNAPPRQRDAILDTVGFVWASPKLLHDSPGFIAALTAEAERTLQAVAVQRPLALHWTTGVPVSDAVWAYLLAIQARFGSDALSERVRQAFGSIEHQGWGNAALVLWQRWLDNGTRADDAWCLPLIGALGDDRLVLPLRAQIDTLGGGARKAIAARLVEVLATIGSDGALGQVDDLARRSRCRPVKMAAQRLFAEAASARGLTFDELVDRSVPNLGFDPRGVRVFDYGLRTFTVQIATQRGVPALQVRDDTGKPLRALPRPGGRNDTTRAEDGFAAWNALTKELKQVGQLQTRRLEQAMIDGRMWPLARWRELFLSHPILRPFAIALVWAAEQRVNRIGPCVDSDTRPPMLFRPLEDGTLTNANDELVALPDDALVHLVHPIALDAPIRDAWLQHVADYEIIQPFPQLARTIVSSDTAEQAARWWLGRQGYLIDVLTLRNRYERAGWQPGSKQHGWYYAIWRSFPAAGIEAVLETGGVMFHSGQTAPIRLGFVRAGSVRRGDEVYDELTDTDPRLLPFGAVPPVVFSEAAADVSAFTSGGQYDEHWRSRVILHHKHQRTM